MRAALLLTVSLALGHTSGLSVGVPPKPTISTARVDTNRSSWNSQEYFLTPANVAASFGKLGAYTTDGYVYSQPLFIPAILTSGGQHDLLIVATMNNSVYAFDANSPGSLPVWNVNLGTARTSYTTPYDFLYSGSVGVLSTPVADVPNNHLFVVSATPTPSYVLYELNLATGATIASVTITGSVSGSGDSMGSDCVSGGVVSFCPQYETQREALTLANGNVYIGFGSFGDAHPWHGWIFGYSASNLSQVGVFCVTPNGYGGAVWSAGSGLAVDAAGDLYVFTGNGTFDGSDFGETVLKLSPTLSLLDWFTPSNYGDLNNADADFAAGNTMLIPGTSYVFGIDKTSRLTMVNTGNMGHLQGGGGQAPAQMFSFGSQLQYGGAFSGSMAYYQNVAFSGSSGYSLYGFAWNGSTFSETPVTGATYGFPGAQYAGSGTTNQILWFTSCSNCNGEISSPPAGTLYAVNAQTLAQIYASASGSDTLGTMSKFAPPTIGYGMVYVATQSDEIVVYGLK